MRSVLFIGLLAIPCFVQAGTWSVPGMDSDQRPRVLYRPGDLPQIQSRLAREPYSTIYLGLFGQAERSYDLSDHSKEAEQAKANIAQAAAFVYAMDRRSSQEPDMVVVESFASSAEREAFGLRAEELLLNTIEYCRMEDYTTGVQDIHCAQELAMYATAYDTLAGAGFVFSDEQAVRDRLATFAADFFYKWTVAYWPTLTRSFNENHGTKTSSAIGLAAIALNGYQPPTMSDGLDGYRDPVDWNDFGASYTNSVGLDALYSLDGGYGEGPTYYRYAAINMAVYYWAWHNYTRGGDWVQDGIIYRDPWQHPYQVATLDWLAGILMPDGTFPPFDDGTPGVTFFWGPFVSFENGPLYQWWWQRGVRPYDVSGSINQALLTLVAHDDSVVPLPPAFGPSVFAPENGQAVFRSGWGVDDIYLIVQAEHGICGGWGFRYDGEWLDGSGGHEHSDAGTTHLMAFGERLLMDSGYLGWENHEKVNQPENHNLLFVDGQGPGNPRLIVPPFTFEDGQVVILDPGVEGGYVPGEDADAYLRHSFASGPLEHARVDTRYFVQAPATDWQRRMVFVDQRYFVQADTATSDDGQAHDYELLSHLNGGGSSGGTFQLIADLGARVDRDSASLLVYQGAAGGQPEFSESENIHDAWRWREETHSVLHARLNSTSAEFLTILYPLATGSEEPQVERLSSSDGLAAYSVRTNDRTDIVALSSPEQGPKQISGLAFEGSFALSSSPARGVVDRILLADGLAITTGPLSLSLETVGTLAVHQNDTQLSGYYSGPPNTLTFHGLVSPAHASGQCSLTTQDGDVVLTLSGDGPIVLNLEGPGSSDSPPVARIAPPGEALAGQAVLLDGSPSCDPDGDPLTYSWQVVDAPIRSRALFSDPNIARPSFTPDWPGHYRLGLTVSAQGQISLPDTQLLWVERGPDPDSDGGFDGDDGGDLTDHDLKAGGGCGCGRGQQSQTAGDLFLLMSLIMLAFTKIRCGR